MIKIVLALCVLFEVHAYGRGPVRPQFDFPALPIELQVDVLLKLPFSDLDGISKSNFEIHQLIKSRYFWERSREVWPVKKIVFYPYFQTFKGLEEAKNIRSYPITHQRRHHTYDFNCDADFEEWGTKTIKELLDPATQFSEIPSDIFQIGKLAEFNPAWAKIGKKEKRIKIQRIPVTQLLWFLVTKMNPAEKSQEGDCWKEYLEFYHYTSLRRQPIWAKGEGIAEPSNWVFTGLCPLHPVENIRRVDVENFISKISNFFPGMGLKFRLPTEAEWERAARGKVSFEEEAADLGSQFYSPYFFGTNISSPGIGYMGSEPEDHTLSIHSWWRDNSRNTTHRVGSKSWNSLGLADMSGNVWEWVKDDWALGYNGENSYDSPLINPEVENPGECPVIRGGGFDSTADELRSDSRKRVARDFHNPNTGFRLVVEVSDPNS